MKNMKFYYALRLVFARPGYWAAALLTTFLFLFGSIWMQNMSWLLWLLAIGKFKILIWTWESFVLNFTPIRMAFALALAVLLGINMAMLIFYLRQRWIGAAAVGGSGLGLIMSLLGVGCAACGSVLLTSFLGYAAAAKFLGILPGGGLEFSIISLALLLFSITLISRKLSRHI